MHTHGCTHSTQKTCTHGHTVPSPPTLQSFSPTEGFMEILDSLPRLATHPSLVCVPPTRLLHITCVCSFVHIHFEAPMLPIVCSHRTCFKKINTGLELAIQQVLSGGVGMYEQLCVHKPHNAFCSNLPSVAKHEASLTPSRLSAQDRSSLHSWKR